MLLRMGCEVRAYTDSTLALEVVESDSLEFDLLVTDHTMPEVTGAQLAEAALAGNPSLAVVMASGYRFGDESAVDGRIVQLDKPFSMAQLKASVEKALGLDRI